MTAPCRLPARVREDECLWAHPDPRAHRAGAPAEPEPAEPQVPGARRPEFHPRGAGIKGALGPGRRAPRRGRLGGRPDRDEGEGAM